MYHPAFQGSAQILDATAAGKLAPTILTDLLVLSWARHANALRALSRIREAHEAIRKAIAISDVAELGPYAEAELAAIYANLLLDEGVDLDLAYAQVGHAIEIFSSFDHHLAAWARILKADVERLQSKGSYLTTCRQAVDQLDTRRNDTAVEVAYNNFLFYLVKEGYVAEALQRCAALPRPRQPRYLANRLCVEGCIHLALGNLELAEKLLEESADLFTEIGKPGDAMIAILYLASTRATRGDCEGARDNLAAAESIANSWGYSVALSIHGLVRCAAPATDLVPEILRIAFEAGGCLGPLGTETPGPC